MKKKLMTIIISLLLICSSIIIVEKYKIEEANRAVELTADYNLFAQFEQRALLKRFAGGALSSIALEEQSLRELAAEQKVSIYSSQELQTLSSLGVRLEGIKADRIYMNASASLLEEMKMRLEGLEYENGIISMPQQKEEQLSKPFYFEQEALDLVSDSKELKLIARFRAETSSQEMAQSLAELTELNTIIFSGEEVVGYPDNLARTAQSLRGLNLGLIEPFLAEQRGAHQLTQRMDYQALRVHSIAQPELERLGSLDAVKRYFKAVRERNVRLLYLKPFAEREETVEFITRLQERLEEAGYKLQTAKPFARAKDNRVLQGLILLLLLSLAALLIDSKRSLFFWSGLVLLAAAYFIPWELFLIAVSLLVAILVPVGEYIYLVDNSQERSLAQVVCTFLVVSLFSTAGGLVITALLFDTASLLQIKVFRGVKLAFILPLLLSLSYYLLTGVNIKEKVQESLASPVSWQQLLTVGVLLVGGLFYLGRTGNQFFLGVSSLELMLRDKLADFFVVRPRFKSFLIGHPLLLLSLSRGRKDYYPYLLLGALIGQINLINTLVHLHMPLKISLLRVGVGVLLGLVIYLAIVMGKRFIEMCLMVDG